jgi:hypothetical protein
VLFTSDFDSHLDPTYSNANAFLHHIESKPSRVEIESSRNRVESKPNRNRIEIESKPGSGRHRVGTESSRQLLVHCMGYDYSMAVAVM